MQLPILLKNENDNEKTPHLVCHNSPPSGSPAFQPHSPASHPPFPPSASVRKRLKSPSSDPKFLTMTQPKQSLKMNPFEMIYLTSPTRCAKAALFGIAVVAAPTSSLGTILYQTSFEEFTAADLLTDTEVPNANHELVSPNSWYYNFGNEATVTTTRARTGSQAIVIDSANSNLRLAGPWSAPILDFEYSFYIEGPSQFGPGIFNFAGDPIGPLRIILNEGEPNELYRYNFIGGAGLSSFDQDEDGIMESLRIRSHGNDAIRLSESVEIGQWNTIKSRYNLTDQTMELTYNDQSLGTVPMANILFGNGEVTEFPFFEMFTLNSPDHSVFVDDFSITGIPEPSSLALLGLGGLALLRRRR